MPPQLLFDIARIDLSKDVFDQEELRRQIPQRGDMEHLNGIVYANPDDGQLIGYKDVRDNEFWVPGHIPGRPLLPGVLMIEAAAQLASFYARVYLQWAGFIGFGGLENVKFRMQVPPGVRMYILAQKLWTRHRRVCCATQGIVKGNVVFEAEVIGTQM